MRSAWIYFFLLLFDLGSWSTQKRLKSSFGWCREDVENEIKRHTDQRRWRWGFNLHVYVTRECYRLLLFLLLIWIFIWTLPTLHTRRILINSKHTIYVKKSVYSFESRRPPSSLIKNWILLKIQIKAEQSGQHRNRLNYCYYELLKVSHSLSLLKATHCSRFLSPMIYVQDKSWSFIYSFLHIFVIW